MQHWAVVGALWVAGCAAAPTPPAHVSQSSSIALDARGEVLWLTSPDDNAVVSLGAVDLVERARVRVQGAPDQLVWIGERLLVSLSQAAEVSVVDPASRSERRVFVPCGGTRGVAQLDATHALVTCPNDDAVVMLALDTLEVTHVFASAGRPTSIAVADDEVHVSASHAGRVRTWSRRALLAAPRGESTPIARERVLESRQGRAATQVDAVSVSPDDGALLAVFQSVDHDGDRSRPPESGGYGSVFDGAPRIEPRLVSPCGTRYARFDGGPRVYSGPSALALRDGLLWVANLYTDDVALIDCTVASSEDSVVLATFRVGRAPRGLALSADGATAYVDLGFDHAVARLRWSGPRADGTLGRDAELTLRRALVGPARFSEAAMRGRSAFTDADDTHLTPSGVVTCATCHPAGGEDGLSWFLHTRGVPRKVRRTPPAWGGWTMLAPYHWDGEFTSVSTLSRSTIQELMDGDALLVDTDAMAQYMAELGPPPPRPLTDAERSQADRGRALFEGAARCATCHTGYLHTDGLRHAVLAPSTDPDADLRDVETPTLIGVRARSPYLHDGRAATLRDVLTVHNAGDTHGVTSALSAGEVDELIAYLRSL